MQTSHTLEFSTLQIKALHKFLGASSMTIFETTEFSKTEKEAVMDGFGVLRCEAEEIALDEYNASIEEH
jgi:hypothetical protein